MGHLHERMAAWHEVLNGVPPTCFLLIELIWCDAQLPVQGLVKNQVVKLRVVRGRSFGSVLEAGLSVEGRRLRWAERLCIGDYWDTVPIGF